MTQPNKKTQQKDQGPPLYVSNAGTGDTIKEASDKGKYIITVEVGKSRSDRSETSCKIYVNGKQAGGVNKIKAARDIALPAMKLDLKKPVTVEVKRTGKDDADDSLKIDTSHLKKKADTGAGVTHKNERFDAKGLPVRSGGKNPVTFMTKNEQKKPEKGHVLIIAGQGIKLTGKIINETGAETAVTDQLFSEVETPRIPTDDSGHATVIIVPSGDGWCTFSHEESGESDQLLLARED